MNQHLIVISIVVVIVFSSSPTSAAQFSCKNATQCEAMLGYTPRNSTTISAVKTLFQIATLRSLLAANGLPLSTDASTVVPAGETIRIAFPCSCTAGRGVSAGRRPVYTVGAGDGLDAIARGVFGGLVTFKEIAEANGVQDPNLIEVGRELWIPLPCSCDDVGEEVKAVHYAYAAKGDGSTVASVATEFGTRVDWVMKVNGISDPKSVVQLGQVLDVPLRACSSSISNISLDHDLYLPNGSYTLTAKDCVICRCSSSNWQLDCQSTQGLSSTICPQAKCGGLSLGNSLSNADCESQTCAYAGYTNKTSFTILTNLTTQSQCSTAGSANSPVPHPNASSSLFLEWQWSNLLVLLITNLLLFSTHN